MPGGTTHAAKLPGDGTMHPGSLGKFVGEDWESELRNYHSLVQSRQEVGGKVCTVPFGPLVPW